MRDAGVTRHGSWQSPITARLIAAGATRLADLIVDGADLYWSEARAAEAGRTVIVRCDADRHIEDMLPAPFSARTRVHEYGGGAFTVADGLICFSHVADGRLYAMRGPARGPRIAAGMHASAASASDAAAPVPLTTTGAYRYADLVIDRARRRVVCVREDHTAGSREPVHALVAVDLDGSGAVHVLAAGADFYAAPRLSPDATTLAWLDWRHPDMPWDGTELKVARLAADGTLGTTERIAGSRDESVLQPEWSPAGRLHFVSDRSGWWNLYAVDHGDVRALCPRAAEFASPPWVFGLASYAFVAPETIACAYTARGRWSLGVLDVASGRLRELDVPYTDIKYVRALPSRTAAAASVAFIGGAPDAPPAIVRCGLATGATTTVRRASDVPVDAAWVAVPEAIEFATTGGATAYAFYYPPRNPEHVPPAGERPPLVVMSHGGPTSAATTGLNLRIQFWTSRGFAVVDVDYRGSTGYGTAYRRLLDGNWGVADVDDCIAAARVLVERGDVDGSRLAITGSSAGGYTTLCALTFHEVFHVGASYYGISDLEALARDTHKFESHYHERLVAPYPAHRDLYRARSPLHFAERLSRPVIFFQGTDDEVVPPDQTARMADALRARGVAVVSLLFEGESHGFRRAETIERALEAELAFYARVFEIPLADGVPSMAIDDA